MMIAREISYLLIGTGVCMIGALPLGLVNLSVLNAAQNRNISQALQMTRGASLVEIIYGILAILTGSMIRIWIDRFPFVNYLLLSVLAITGVIFFFKKENWRIQAKPVSKGFIKGILLNLISIQVLLYWIVAISILTKNDLVPTDISTIILFASGIWLGEILVFRLYIFIGQRFLQNSAVFTRNINRIIGAVLFLAVALKAMSI